MEQQELETREFIIEDELGSIVGDLALISFVSDPAIEQPYQLFNKGYQFAKTEEEKQLVTGCAMRAGFKILRQDPRTGELFNAVFTAEQVRKCAEVFLSNSNHLQTNLEHGNLLGKNEIEGVAVVESWIVEDPENDKAKALGFSDISAGDWYVSFKIKNKAFWDFLKTYKGGFSIEGIFKERLAAAFSKKSLEEQVEKIAFSPDLTDKQKEKAIAALLFPAPQAE